VLVSADGTVALGGYPWAPTLDGGFTVLELPFARRGHRVGGAYRQGLSVRPRTARLRVRPTILRATLKWCAIEGDKMDPTTSLQSSKHMQVSKAVRKLLLLCGILAPLIYVGSDIMASLLWDSYSFTDQSVSELRAIEAPTRPFLIPLLGAYTVLEIAFGLGVWRAAGPKRALIVTGVLLIGLGVVDLVAPFFPMHLREEIRSSGRSLSDTMHIVITAATVLLILLIVWFGATANGKWFRLYSYATILVLLACGVWSSFDVPRIEANLPTLWLGVKERINIYGYMVWTAMLSSVLLCVERNQGSTESGHG
jgi:hypothetical protein